MSKKRDAARSGISGCFCFAGGKRVGAGQRRRQSHHAEDVNRGRAERKLTPEEEERQKQIDADYKAATSKIPAQKAPDPWADVRQGPAASGPKASASTQNALAQKKKKQSAQQPQ